MSTPHDRFVARRKTLRDHTRRRRLMVLLTVLAVGALVYLVAFSSVLDVRNTRVSGADRRLAGEVRAMAASQRGTPLARADTRAVAEKVRAIPAVAAVSVGRSWPHTLVVEVTPRTPVMKVTRGGSSPLLVDTQGVRFPDDECRRPGLPVIPVAGADPHRADLRPLASVVRSLTAVERSSLRKVSIGRDGEVTFSLGRLEVRWGGGGDSAAKAKALRTMRPIAERDGARRLDLTAPDRPVLANG